MVFCIHAFNIGILFLNIGINILNKGIGICLHSIISLNIYQYYQNECKDKGNGISKR